MLIFVQCSVDDDTFMSTMNVGPSYSHEYWSQQYASQQNEEFKVDKDGEGLINGQRGRAGNYTSAEDVTMQGMVQCGHGSDRWHVRNKRYLGTLFFRF